jgi:N-acetylmuramoyl-L-alanine amidase CwlA
VTWKGWGGVAFTPADFIEYVASKQFTAWRPRFCVLHNTQIPTLAQWHRAGGAKYMQSLEHYYRNEQGWSGGPHLFVDDAVIWIGTPLTVPGVHAPSWNAISWGIEIVGDYDHESFSLTTLQNTASALATLHGALGLDPLTLKFHKEDPLTSHKGCPGKAVVKADVIQLVQAKLAARHAGEHLPDRRLA